MLRRGGGRLKDAETQENGRCKCIQALPPSNRASKKISNSLGDSGERATEVPGLMFYRRSAPIVPNPSTYEPSLLVIAQGRIRVDLGKGYCQLNVNGSKSPLSETRNS